MKRARVVRALFAGYATLLFIGTHWPNLRVEGPVARSDLWVHLMVFGAWAALAAACGFFGPVFSARNLVLTWMVAVGYACIDEGLQAIPALGRTCAWDDLGFNILGVSLAMAGMGALGRLNR